MRRPRMQVLPDSALVPSGPCTHEVIRRQPLYHTPPQPGARPDGHFAAGTPVVMVAQGPGRLCQVQGPHGLCAWTAAAGLRERGG
jgi:hypothetical protein